MIHLFKKVRQQLIKDNRLRKYFFYALGEVLLVVIGIALALQFNAWNIENENTKKESWYLTNIVEDLLYQRIILKDMVDHYEASIALKKSIIHDYMVNFSFASVDSLDDKLNYLTTTYDFPNIDNTYRELISSGQFSLISDKTLSIEIINYYLLCEANDNDVNNDLNNIFYKEIYPALNKYSQVMVFEETNATEKSSLDILDPSLTLHIQNTLKKPMAKLELINAIKTQLVLQNNFLFLVEENIVENDSLIKSIDKYLGLTSDMVNAYD